MLWLLLVQMFELPHPWVHEKEFDNYHNITNNSKEDKGDRLTFILITRWTSREIFNSDRKQQRGKQIKHEHEKCHK